jgi:hypothetical protein
MPNPIETATDLTESMLPAELFGKKENVVLYNLGREKDTTKLINIDKNSNLINSFCSL